MPGLLRLADYPYAKLRVLCRPCGRQGRYGVARLAERHGADIPLHDLLRLLTAGCRWQRAPTDPPPRPYEPRCLACLPDLTERPPGAPGLRVVAGGRG